MFQNILVAEDVDSTHIALVQAFEHIGAKQVDHAQYCDDALLKIRKAAQDKNPYGLLVTDLSFKDLRHGDRISSGEQLIAAVKKNFPEIKIIVYSIEDKSYRIRTLFETYSINGYIIKGRTSITELQRAAKSIHEGNDRVTSAAVTDALNEKSLLEIESYDIELLKLLSKGITQENIGHQFKQAGISPNSSSSIEKHISRLKEYFRANNNVHLIAIAKDLGLV